MLNKSSFNWFPGHMNKSIKEIQKIVPIIDLVIEIVDARAPLATQNQIFKKLLNKTAKLIIMTKGDLADEATSNLWIEYFKKINIKVYLIKSKQQNILADILKLINSITEDRQKKLKAKGIETPHLNILIVGIPNVGKSTVISKLCKGKTLKIANRPGVTIGLHRINMTQQITLIDSPGILPSKFIDEKAAYTCAAVNTIKLTAIPKEKFALTLMLYLYESYHLAIVKVYYQNNLFPHSLEVKNIDNIFKHIAQTNNFFLADKTPDIKKSYDLFINDLLHNKFGRISFESPIEIENQV